MSATVQVAELPISDQGVDTTLQLDAALLLASADVLLIAVEGTRIRFASPAIQRVLGYRPDELLGREVTEFLTPGDDERVASRAHSRQHGADEPSHYEIQAHHRDGSLRWLEIKVTPLSQGEHVLSLATVHDITVRKSAELELERAHTELDLFTARIAHDLRTPLHGVMGYTRLLQQHPPCATDEEARDYLSKILQTSEQAVRLLDGLHELSQLARSAIQRSEVDLSALARAVAYEVLGSRGDRSIDLLFEPGVRAYCDASLVRVLLTNLIDNALKYGAGREPLRLEFGSALDGDVQTLYLRDNGPGFELPPDADLFAPFERLAASRDTEGFGLGLATARRIVEHHGGQIWAESTPGEGATFFFTLGSNTRRR